jgi:hypothetical protein
VAISKPIEHPSGAVASYHHVAGVVWEKRSPGRVEVMVDSFVDLAAREIGKSPMSSERLNLETVWIEGSPDLTLATLYTQLKTLEPYSGGTDA